MLPQVDMVETVDRTVEWLTNTLGRSPTIDEIAEAAGVGYDEVLTALDAFRPLAGMHARTALYLRCVEGLDRTQIARRLGVRCAEVSRLLRALNLCASPQQGPEARVTPWLRSRSHSAPASPGAARTSSPG
jgi:hypothetical protein